MKRILKFEQLKAKLYKGMIILASHFFLCFFGAVILALAFSSFVFYIYAFSNQEIKQNSSENFPRLKQDIYEKINAVINEERSRYDSINSKAYKNVFEAIK